MCNFMIYFVLTTILCTEMSYSAIVWNPSLQKITRMRTKVHLYQFSCLLRIGTALESISGCAQKNLQSPESTRFYHQFIIRKKKKIKYIVNDERILNALRMIFLFSLSGLTNGTPCSNFNYFSLLTKLGKNFWRIFKKFRLIFIKFSL